MNTLKTSLTSLALFLASSKFALAATCRVNGEEVPCPDVPGWLVIIPILGVLIGLALVAFWLWMLIDAIQNQEKEKGMWIALIIFLSGPAALVYYFTQKRKRGVKK